MSQDLNMWKAWEKQMAILCTSYKTSTFNHLPIYYALVGVIVGRNKCRHLCYGQNEGILGNRRLDKRKSGKIHSALSYLYTLIISSLIFNILTLSFRCLDLVSKLLRNTLSVFKSLLLSIIFKVNLVRHQFL